jgi:hypothetical protein
MHDNYKKANASPRCVHLLPGGLPCTQPARRGHRFCRFHDPVAARNLRMHLPIIEDAPSLQFAVAEVVSALVAGKIDKDSAAVAFQGIRLAAENLKDFQAEMNNDL